jgi:predicted esterase
MRIPVVVPSCFIVVLTTMNVCCAQTALPRTIETAFSASGENRSEIESAWQRVPEAERPGLRFLLEFMPDADLKNLTSEYLLENISLAYQARSSVKWGKEIPDEIFLNDVLPYAVVNERRDTWRSDFHKRFSPIVQDISRPGEAAAKLNRTIFQDLNVKYSTKRRRADQGPRESMDSGLASCTGLSILLIDACRAVGIPARFVGTPLWSDNSGNHSWVEIWDGEWKFTGAAEPTGDQLNQAWFVDRASTAQPDNLNHAIFATSFRSTPLSFPMVWARDNKEVFAINVTQRYLKTSEPLPDGFVRLRVKTMGASGPDRCRANVIVRDLEGNILFRGQSKDEGFDANDHLTIPVPKGKQLEIEIQGEGPSVNQTVVANEDGKLITLTAAKPPTLDPIADADTPGDPLVQLREWLKKPRAERGDIDSVPFANLAIDKVQCEQALQMLCHDHLAYIRDSRAAEMDAKVIKVGEFEMPFELKKFGKKPADGHALVISMHGGGGVSKRVNDQQWQNQKGLYDLEEGIYVTPRAPTDSWNMWHQAHIDSFYTRLIENLIAIEGINPNRVYIMGYSAGGDGVYQLAPRMADQLAAAAMMAGHPNETRPDGLRNLPFTLHVGGKDAAYNRNTIAKNWAEQLDELRKSDSGGYEHWVKIYPDKGHWMDREDREGVTWMMKFTRNFLPKRIVWLQDDVTHQRFYWLGADVNQAQAGDRIVAKQDGNVFTVEQTSDRKLCIFLRDDMADLDEEIIVRDAARELWRGKVTRNIKTLHRTLTDRGDPTSTFSSVINVN